MDFCKEAGVTSTHAKGLFRNAYKNLSPTPWVSPSDGPLVAPPLFPKKLSSLMDREFIAEGLFIREAAISKYDGSVKFSLELSDHLVINAVLMPESKRLTLCLSSQVGCRQACVFCSSARMGFKRNLSAGEIVGQVVTANRWLATHPNWLCEKKLSSSMHLTNVVFMGMGEPLDNTDAVTKAILIMNSPWGLNLPLRHISVSTVGHLDGLRQLLSNIPDVRIALSVNAASDEKRSKLMPINKRFPLTHLLNDLAELTKHQKHSLLIQYLLLQDFNDGPAEAEELASLLKNLRVKVNLIPYNPPYDDSLKSALKSPDPERVARFKDVLYHKGIRVMTRYSKGQDIGAACGHLIVF